MFVTALPLCKPMGFKTFNPRRKIGCSQAKVLVLCILCSLVAAQCGAFSCFDMFLIVLLLFLSSTVIILLWERGHLLLSSCLVCGLCTFRHGLFALLLGIIGRICTMIVTIPEHLYTIFLKLRLYWHSLYEYATSNFSTVIETKRYLFVCKLNPFQEQHGNS